MKLLISFLTVVLASPAAFSAETFECRTSARFSSQGSVGQAVTEAIRGARSRLTLALYGFDNTELGDELLKLAQKKVVVRIKIDSGRSDRPKIVRLIEALKAGGVQVQTVAPDGRNHNKFAVIDGTKVITGSYNWTLKAEKNWENVLILDCPELAKAYESEWEKIR